jgi:hypothetical protein
VVDDAIVVLENVTRFIEKGMTPVQAAFRGAREIGFTVLSMSTSLVAVFIPILLMGGIVGRHLPGICGRAQRAIGSVAPDFTDPDAHDVRQVSQGREGKSTGTSIGPANGLLNACSAAIGAASIGSYGISH